MGGIALCGAGGCRYLCGVAVSQLGNAHIKGEAAIGGGFPGIPSCTGSDAGSPFRHRVAVVRGIQLRQRHRSSGRALGTGSGKGTCRRGSRCLGCLVAIAMPGCAGVGVFIAVRAAGAGMGGIALCGASGCRYLCGVAVSQLSNAHIKVEAAIGGGLPGIPPHSGCRAGCSLRGGVIVIRSSQLRQGYRRSKGALRAASGQCTGCRSGRRFGDLEAKAMRAGLTALFPNSVKWGVCVFCKAATMLISCTGCRRTG